MDNFELKPEPKAKRTPLIWNILTVVVLLGICGLAYLFSTIFLNPTSRLNPFPPAPLPTLFQTVTPTATIILQPPTWTPTPTLQPSPSRTKAPTWTLLPGMATLTITETPTATLPEGTPTIILTPMPATVEITYQASTTIHANLACNWMGVGGKVMDTNDKPLTFQTVQVGGTLGGKAVNSMIRLSGSSPEYGTSGFEFKLGDLPVASTQTLWIQLFDNSGNPLTGQIYFDTYNDCGKNLAMVVFTKTK